jgi:copper(I)-binding protein
MHVMLSGLQRPLRAGDGIRFSLTFEHSGVISVEALVVKP